MARPKIIDDTTLLNLIEQFFIHECKGNPKKLKKPEIAQYVAKQGYPDYAVTTLRRNKIACDYIDSLRTKEKDKRISLLTAHKTLDVENFLIIHRSKSALTKALTELDCYYKTIADSAVDAIKERKALITKIETLQSNLLDVQLEVKEYTETIANQKATIKQLTAEVAALKAVVKDYVYPDICNELLSQTKELRNVDTIIEKKKLQRKIITFNTKTDLVPSKEPMNEPITPTNSGSSVVQRLTDIFEEDDE